jgi:O-antigen ligase
MMHFLLMAMCAVVFLIVYDLGRRLSSRPWAIAAPLIILAAAEGALGFAQSRSGSIATGTFSIRNNYAGFLGMVLPLAVVHPLSILNRDTSSRWGGGLEFSSVLEAVMGMGAAALIFMGLVTSLSRMGLLSALGAVIIVAIAFLYRGRRRSWPVLAGGTLAIVLAAALLVPGQFLGRFTDLSQEDRPEVWRETGHLIAAYPVFGCGLGAFEAAFYPFKASNPALIQEYAHNDYLQYLAEMGLAGYLLALIPLATILFKLARGKWKQSGLQGGWLGLASLGSVVAIGLHSIADFNLYIPANMLVFAWLMGIAACAGTLPEERRAQGNSTPRDSRIGSQSAHSPSGQPY